MPADHLPLTSRAMFSSSTSGGYTRGETDVYHRNTLQLASHLMAFGVSCNMSILVSFLAVGCNATNGHCHSLFFLKQRRIRMTTVQFQTMRRSFRRPANFFAAASFCGSGQTSGKIIITVSDLQNFRHQTFFDFFHSLASGDSEQTRRIE